MGVITGLIPGIHVNLIVAIVLSMGGGMELVGFIVALAVTHTFLDSIPSIFLGAPDSAMALLPGHKYLVEGNGHYAVQLTALGSYGALLLSLIMVPFLIIAFPFVFDLIRPVFRYFLMIVVVLMILRDGRSLSATLVFVLSGLLGLVVLNTNISNVLCKYFNF